jgi:exopolyphosphatase/guanosine-5'-triphosphate,3'-diphosphate pyrophosphatase
VTPAAIRRLRETLLKAGHVDGVGLKALAEDRLPVFPGGVVILESIVEALDIDEIDVAEGALREGLLYDLLGRIRHEDPRSRSVEALAERYHVDREHAARVEGTALRCLDQVAEDWELRSPEDMKLLAWASRLHEIGLDIAHSHYHRHGAYITEHADLAGFSRQEQRLVATLVRAHRRKFPMSAIKLLPKPWRRPITRLAILLRIAVKLNRSRNPDPLPRMRLTAGAHALRIEFPDGWLDEYPLTRRDLEHEAIYMKTAGYALEIT